MNVESFNLDHTKVAAPFVRVADRKRLPGGDELVKYDVRFCQPNAAHLEMEAVHSIEHLSAELMRNHTDRLIDWSPMGCQTGFYALTLGLDPEEFTSVLEATSSRPGRFPPPMRSSAAGGPITRCLTAQRQLNPLGGAISRQAGESIGNTRPCRAACAGRTRPSMMAMYCRYGRLAALPRNAFQRPAA